MTTRRGLYLGVDGGATKTACWVASEDGLLGVGRSGPSSLGASHLADHVQSAVAEALGAAGAELSAVSRVVLGMSGADFEEDYTFFRDLLRPLFGSVPFRIVNDTEVALVGGSRTNWGVVSICGTGTNCLGRSPSGEVFTIGGMGYDGDYGGGGELAQAAIAHAFRGAQGRGPQTVLADDLLRMVNLPDFSALSHAMHVGHPVTAAVRRQLVLRVFAAAGEGDRVAQDILVEMGEALGATAGAAARRLLPHTDAVVDVVQAGSVWGGQHPLMRDAFQLAVHRYATRVDIHLALREPVAGAVLIAAADAGAAVDTVRRGLPAWAHHEELATEGERLA